MRNIPLVLRALLCLTVALAMPSPVGAVTFTVGVTADCSHSTLQSAIDALPASGDNSVRISSLTYTGQALTIDGKVAVLAGGYAACSQTVASSTTTISGLGGTHDSVVTVLGNSDVILENLTITRGDEVSDGYGGGIDFRGTGFLTLRNVIVSQNYAGYGGGINFSPTSGNGELRIEAGTVIQNNIAQFSGGGIRVAGSARLLVLGDNIAITGNEALGIEPISKQPLYGNGGGIEIIAPASAEIGSPGFGNNGVITFNRARYGGGLSIHGADSRDFADVRLFTTDPTRPVRISGNRATVLGGAIYMEPNASPLRESPARLCAFDFRFDNNRAQNGSAIYADKDFDGVAFEYGSYVFLNGFECFSEPRSVYGARPCDHGVLCNSIDHNVDENSIGQPTPGATIFVQSDSKLVANRVLISGNIADQAIRVVESESPGGDQTEATLSNCLITGNRVVEVIRSDADDTSVDLQDCTIAGNAISGPRIMNIGDDLKLLRSILWQPGKLSMNVDAHGRVIDEVIASELGTLINSRSVIDSDPRFMDADHADFHLQAASPAVDFSAFSGGNDAEGRQRDIDLALVPNRFGPRDLGAFERQSVGNLLRNADFLTDLHFWSTVIVGVSSWQGAGASTPGSALIRVSPSQLQPVTGLSQCIRIPGPGAYRLSGKTYGDGNGVSRDYAAIRWRYIPSTGDNCQGLAATSGTLFFPRSSVFTTPTQPFRIDVPADSWTPQSAIEVSLVATEGSQFVTNVTSAHFDDIRLEPVFE